MKPKPAMLKLGAASLASGLLLSAAFASSALGCLAWVALVPMLLVLRGHSLLAAGLAGLAWGSVAALGTFGWLLEVPAVGPPQATVLALYLALYPACWCMGVVRLMRSRAPLLLAAPALWVALEAVRAQAGFLALPWATLAQSQHHNLALLQLASLGGEAAVSFVVALGNVVIAGWVAGWVTGRVAGSVPGRITSLRRPASTSLLGARRVALAAGAVLLAHGAGLLMLLAPDAGPVLQVAAIQPSIGVAERNSAAGREAIWQRLHDLTWAAANSAPASRQQPLLVVWPETAVGDPQHDVQLAARLAALARASHTVLVVGAAETEKFRATEGQQAVLLEREQFNSAYLVAPNAPLSAPYRKRRLLPFGETVPLQSYVVWPRWLVPDILSGQAGDHPANFWLARDGATALRIGVLICWENTFAELARDAVRGRAQVLVQLTNDAWFGHTRASAQHNAISVLRAVENHVPVVIASNSGRSQIISARGRIVAQGPGLFEQGTATAAVAVGAAGTLYTRTGDVWAWACAAVAAVSLSAPSRQARVHRPEPVFQARPFIKESP